MAFSAGFLIGCVLKYNACCALYYAGMTLYAHSCNSYLTMPLNNTWFHLEQQLLHTAELCCHQSSYKMYTLIGLHVKGLVIGRLWCILFLPFSRCINTCRTVVTFYTNWTCENVSLLKRAVMLPGTKLVVATM